MSNKIQYKSFYNSVSGMRNEIGVFKKKTIVAHIQHIPLNNFDNKVFMFPNSSYFIQNEIKKRELINNELDENSIVNANYEEQKTQKKEIEQLEGLRNVFKNKLEIYKRLSQNFSELNSFKEWCSANEIQFSQMLETLKKEIERAKSINDYKQVLIRGAEFYLPNNTKDPFNKEILEEINLSKEVLGNSTQFKGELVRIINIFIKNSKNIELPLMIINDIVRNFFADSGKKIKEIFGLKEDSHNKWLEKIPKLGLIPKVLRVAEQEFLMDALMKDYKFVSSIYFKDGISPLLQKYNMQYQAIISFIDKHFKNLNANDKEIIKNYRLKIEESKAKRFEFYNKVLDEYAKGGLNINNISRNLKKKNSLELATKTLFTLLPFVS